MPNHLQERDKEVVWHPFTPLLQDLPVLPIRRAKGVYLYTDSGRAILDAVSSWWVNIHGHSNEYIAEAISRQARELEHVIFAGFTHEPAVKLAEGLLNILPSRQAKVFYSDNGSTAVEVALKMAFQYWHNKGGARTKVIALEGAYHGDTFGAMSVGDRNAFVQPFKPFLFEVSSLPFPDGENNEALMARFRKLVDTGEVAAFIFEPLIQGSGGMRMYPAAVLDELLRIAREAGVICIADEVMTGFGRTGRIFASDYLQHQPDIFCLSKGLTGGTMPLGVTTCTEEIQAAFRDPDIMKTFFHGHSFTANPLACAVANASMELLLSDDCQSSIARIAYQQSLFADRLSDHPKVQNARSLGTIMALDIRTEEGTSYFNSKRNRLYTFFLDKDILLRPLGNTLYILPPYVIKEEELDRIYSAIEELLDKL
ncbi:adenosylmethionine--8-amino-7-oxononanoate transaminase [Nafulsella turpanensis]|uniref:adenosylmethionine--8-amino-7-oxononanoate transaminase n=1 Tax=Nafulsella turpanensis TaxID=1265690 RepID=UPI00034ACBFE|nr:adenosylmethionine--8-amino-7-oxononanoate transaminase [Nafulsella turpanensis]